MSTEPDISDLLGGSTISNTTTPTRTSSSGSLDTIDSILKYTSSSLFHAPGDLGMSHSPQHFSGDHPSTSVVASIDQLRPAFPFTNNVAFPMLTSSPTLTTTADSEMSFPIQPLDGRRILRPARSVPHPYIPRHPSSRVLRRNNSTSTPLTTFGQKPSRSNAVVLPAIDQSGQVKCCDNCTTAETPSWRRHPETQKLLCNACGLYLRLHRRARPITLDESGRVQVIRKNAAVQREPINMLQGAMYSPRISSQHNGFNHAFNYMSQTLQPALHAANTTLSALQGMDNQQLMIDAQQHHLNYSTTTPDNERIMPGIADDMLHLNVIDNRMSMSPVRNDIGWLQDICSPQPINSSPDIKSADIHTWLNEDKKHP
ncbi:hypothetical protein H4R24_000598 [Coemansia sp. RSA 988]|nr:hypothetical protein H4R24_000598 [Coemansia sp. RSA 988]